MSEKYVSLKFYELAGGHPGDHSSMPGDVNMNMDQSMGQMGQNNMGVNQSSMDMNQNSMGSNQMSSMNQGFNQSSSSNTMSSSSMSNNSTGSSNYLLFDLSGFTMFGKLMISALFHVMFILIFAFIYFSMKGEEHFVGLGSDATFMDCLYFSMTTSSTVGYGDISPKSQTARFLVVIHQFIVLMEVIFTLAPPS